MQSLTNAKMVGGPGLHCLGIPLVSSCGANGRTRKITRTLAVALSSPQVMDPVADPAVPAEVSGGDMRPGTGVADWDDDPWGVGGGREPLGDAGTDIDDDEFVVLSDRGLPEPARCDWASGAPALVRARA